MIMLIFMHCFCSFLSWMKQIESWMLVFRMNWNLYFSAYQKTGKTYSFLQQQLVICKSCVSVIKISCMPLKLMKGLRRLRTLSNRLYSSLKMWRMYICCISCLKWKIWVLGLPSSLSLHAGIFLYDVFEFFITIFCYMYFGMIFIFILKFITLFFGVAIVIEPCCHFHFLEHLIKQPCLLFLFFL